MKRIIRLIFSVLSSLSCLTYGYAGNVDLSLEINLDPITEVEFLQTGTFSITVSNLGPDTAGGDSTSNFPIAAISNGIFENKNGQQDLFIGQNTDLDQVCFFILAFGSPLPGGLPSVVYNFAYPKIPANESITCYGKYLVGFETGSRDFTFTVRSFSDNETNLSNNTANFTFRIKPKTVPTLNFYAILILIVLMIGVAKYLNPKLWRAHKNYDL
ncbi:MAG: hypothetical protein AB8B80_02090 [Marinicellaceae bacterium]